MENITTVEVTDVTTCDVMDPVNDVIKVDASNKNEESSLEKAIFGVFIVFLILWIYTGNSLAIYIILKWKRFRTPGNYIKCVYAFNDMALNTFSNPFMLIILLMDDPNSMSITACRTISILSITFTFSTMYMTTYIALERYFYFCYPFKYVRYFSPLRIAVVSVLIILIPVVWCVVTGIVIGRRQLSTAAMLCQLPQAIKALPSQMIIFLFPSIFGILLSFIQIFRLRHRALKQVHCQAEEVGQAGLNPAVVTPTNLKSMKAALRLLLLTSGSFWGTLIPSWAMRTIVLTSGSSWEDLDNRVNIWNTIVIRMHVLILSSFASALNPIIYFALHADFRAALAKTFGRKSKFSWESEADTVTSVY